MTEYRIEEAASRRAEAEAQLFRDDGSKVYGEQEHKERMAAIKREASASFDRIDADVARKVQEAEQALLVAENADPASTLTTEESQALREQAYYRRRGVRDAFDLYAQRGYWTGAAS